MLFGDLAHRVALDESNGDRIRLTGKRSEPFIKVDAKRGHLGGRRRGLVGFMRRVDPISVHRQADITMTGKSLGRLGRDVGLVCRVLLPVSLRTIMTSIDANRDS